MGIDIFGGMKLPDRCVLSLTLDQAIDHEGKRDCLMVTLWRERGAWEERGDAAGLTSMIHSVKVSGGDGSGDVLNLELTVDFHPDPWRVGGRGRYSIALKQESAEVWSGTYTGTFQGTRLSPLAVSGGVQAHCSAPFTVACPLPSEVPAVLQEWLSKGPAGRLGDWTRCGETGDAIAEGPSQRFRVQDFGAHPDTGRDTTMQIQAAINACAAAGGGIVEFPPGRFELALDRDDTCLEISHDHVRLVGAGSGPGGTLIYAHRPGRSDDIKKPWRAGRFPRFLHIGHKPASILSEQPITGEVVARLCGGETRGMTTLSISEGKVEPGVYLLEQEELEDYSLGSVLTAPSGRRGANWKKAGRPLVRHFVRILSVNNGCAQLDVPLAFQLEARWKPKLRKLPLIRGCGVSHLRIATAWDSFFEHHRDDLHDDGWDAINLDQTAGCHFHDLVFESVTTAIGMSDAFANRIENCRITGNPGHNGFCIGGGSTRCLLKGNHLGRQMHAVNLSSTICQNAIVDCEGDEPSGIDFHGSAGLDTLIDGLVGCVCTGGGSPENIPPRHGPGLVFWNWRCGSFHPYKAWKVRTCALDAQEMPGFILVGAHGRRPLYVLDHNGQKVVLSEGNATGPWGTVELMDRRVSPKSLWAFQRTEKSW